MKWEKPFVLAERCELGQLALRANEDTTTFFSGLTASLNDSMTLLDILVTFPQPPTTILFILVTIPLTMATILLTSATILLTMATILPMSATILLASATILLASATILLTTVMVPDALMTLPKKMAAIPGASMAQQQPAIPVVPTFGRSASCPNSQRSASTKDLSISSMLSGHALRIGDNPRSEKGK